MILISHRGNLDGPQPERENSLAYIRQALSRGFDVEIDVWFIDGKWFLGHDGPTYAIDFKFLETRSLWIHCKNYEALQELIPVRNYLNFFYHTDEDYVLTSRGYIWAYPNQKGSKYTICVMPEWNETFVEGFDGVCTDYITRYDKINSLRPGWRAN